MDDTLSLKKIFLEHKGKISDKWSLYLEVWNEFLAPYREESIRLLEIGIQNGGSLEIWGKYFKNAEKLIGCDIDQNCLKLRYEDDRVKIVVADANSEYGQQEILKYSNQFDIIIDDGSHKSDDIIQSFIKYFPYLNDDGLYLVEDLHCSYWKDYNGGLHNPFSAMAFFKRLTDILNYEHWRNNKARSSLLVDFAEKFNLQLEDFDLLRMHSIEFINSCCVIKKASPDKNILGKRMVMGEDDQIVPGIKRLNKTTIHDIPFEIVDDEKHDVINLLNSNKNLQENLFELDQQASNYQVQLEESEWQAIAYQAQLAEREEKEENYLAQLAEREQQVATNKAQLEESERQAIAYKEQLAEREQKEEKYLAQLLEFEKSIKLILDEKLSINHNLNDLQMHLNQREQILQDLNSKLLEIYSSTAWKLIKLMWNVRLFLAPKGSGREILGKKLFSLLKKRKKLKTELINAVDNQNQRIKSQKELESIQAAMNLNDDQIDFQYINYSNKKYKHHYFQQISIAKGEMDEDFVELSEEDFSYKNLPAKLISFYLPQYHPIPENDGWWGKGFTEWTNVAKAVPQFVGHYQPHLPGELGFYDLRVPEVQRRQVELAKKYGIYGFCFYYYWFNGKRLLEKPLEQFMLDPEIDFPFCICWANENWTRRWDGLDNEVLISQDHSVKSDSEFIHDLIPYLKHPNYLRINGCPVVLVYRVDILENPLETTKYWREYVFNEGIDNLYLIAMDVFNFKEDPKSIGFDAVSEFPPNTLLVDEKSNIVEKFNPNFEGRIYDYGQLIHSMLSRRDVNFIRFKAVMPSWDNTARKKDRSTIFINSSPVKFSYWLRESINMTKQSFSPSLRFIFINAWNEWAEGTHLEPDRKFGYGYLQSVASTLKEALQERKRIKYLFISHDANAGGSQKVLFDLLKWFKVNTLIDIKIICLSGGKLIKEFNKISKTLIFSEISTLTKEDQKKKILDFCGGIPDLIYGNTVVSGQIYYLLSEFNIPILTHVHELQSAIDKYASNVIDDVIKFSDYYIACSYSVKQNLEKSYKINPEKIFTGYSFIIPKNNTQETLNKKINLRQKFGIESEKFIVLGCGIGMPFRKGADLFIETAVEIKERGLNNIQLYWIGDFDPQYSDPIYGEWNDYLKRIEQYNLNDIVSFLGYIDNPKDWLEIGDVFLLTSREDPFPLVMLEAADAKLPIIFFNDTGGSSEFVTSDMGFSVPYQDTKKMALKIIYLYNNKDVQMNMGKKAQERLLQNFTLEKIAPRILDFSSNISKKKVNQSKIWLNLGKKNRIISPNNEPYLSIILPNYNHEKYLSERLESIKDQTFQDYELIIMDDASSDNSKLIIERYYDLPNVKVVINEENSGSPFKQWVKGIPMAKGELIWIAESDDTCEPDFLEKLIPAFENTKVQLAYCSSHVINDQGKIIGKYSDMDYLKSLSTTKWNNSYCVAADQEVNDALGIKNTILNISSAIFRKFNLDDIFLETITNMKISGDTYLELNAIKGGYIYYEADSLNFHRRHESSIIGNLLNQKNEEWIKVFFNEYLVNTKFAVENFKLSPDFLNKVEQYLMELSDTFYSNEPFEKIQKFLSNSNLKHKIIEN